MAALTRCYDCREPISASATICPHCGSHWPHWYEGADVDTGVEALKWVGMVILVFLFLMCVCACLISDAMPWNR